MVFLYKCAKSMAATPAVDFVSTKQEKWLQLMRRDYERKENTNTGSNHQRPDRRLMLLRDLRARY